MVDLTILMARHTLWLVALNTLVHELGVPLPLTPTLLVAGAGSVAGGAHPLALIATVMVATLVGNSVWFAAGRRYGSGTLRLVCRVLLSPDACLTRTQESFRRWGGSSLVVGRFIPGVSLVAPPLAGALGMSWSRFIALSAAGAALWGLVVVGAGMLLHEQLETVIRVLDGFGREAVAAVVLLLAIYVAWRWRERRRRKTEASRDTPPALDRLRSADRSSQPARHTVHPLIAAHRLP